MEIVKSFLESSTIHGLSYISTGRKYARLLWIIVVIAGFTGAGFMIYQSFQSWNESPVKTTIENRPIMEAPYPKLTVCPPKNTYTDLNFDLMMAENMTLDNHTRHNLTAYAIELLFDELHDSIMADLNNLQEENRYYNWYYGHSQIRIYRHNLLETTASSGAIFTQYFGDKFDADRVETHHWYQINIWPQDTNSGITLHLNIEKISLKALDS